MSLTFSFPPASQPLQSDIIALCGSACKENLSRVNTEKISDFLSPFGYNQLCLLSIDMCAAMGVSAVITVNIDHQIKHPRIDGIGGVVIKVKTH